MTREEIKNKCKERAKIFQQAMESCKSSNPIDCIEWFADRIAELEKENAELKAQIEKMKCCQNCKHCAKIPDYDLDNEEDNNIEFCEVRCHEKSGWELKE